MNALLSVEIGKEISETRMPFPTEWASPAFLVNQGCSVLILYS